MHEYILEELSKAYKDNRILLVYAAATWHKSKGVIKIHILSYTPEMNPIKQIWKQIKSIGFKNEPFHSLADVMDKLCETVNNLTQEMMKSITHRD